MTTVAENIVASLRRQSIERVSGLPGDSLNGFTDAIRRDELIDLAATNVRQLF